MARAHLAAPALVYALDPHGLAGLAGTVAVAGLSDLLDGAVARRLGSVTQLGGALDPVVDGLFFGVTAVGLAIGGAYPAWIAAVVVVRYAGPAAVGGILLLTGRRPKLEHTFFGQVATAVIALLLGWVALWRGLGLPSERIVTAASVLIPLVTLLAFGNLAWNARGAGTRRVP